MDNRGSCGLSLLPDEVILEILSYLAVPNFTILCKCALINHRWNTLSEDHILWNSISKHNQFNLTLPISKKQVLEYFKRLVTEGEIEDRLRVKFDSEETRFSDEDRIEIEKRQFCSSRFGTVGGLLHHILSIDDPKERYTAQSTFIVCALERENQPKARDVWRLLVNVFQGKEHCWPTTTDYRTAWKKLRLESIRRNIMEMIKLWITLIPETFFEESCGEPKPSLEELVCYIEQIREEDEWVNDQVGILSQFIQNQRQVYKNRSEMMNRFKVHMSDVKDNPKNLKTCSEESNRKFISEVYDHLLKFSAEHLALTLTEMDFELHSDINIADLRPPQSTGNNQYIWTTSVKRAISLFNTVSYLVKSSILLPSHNGDKRKQIVNFWIEVGFSCLDTYHNYHTSFSILSAFNSYELFRCHFVPDLLTRKNKQRWGTMDKVLTSNLGYIELRTAMKTAEDTKTPCIPYMGILLTDLVFIEESARDYVVSVWEHLLNWRKYQKMFSAIMRYKSFQSTPYPSSSKEVQTKKTLLKNLISDLDYFTADEELLHTWCLLPELKKTKKIYCNFPLISQSVK